MLNEHILESFRDELRKEALSPNLSKLLLSAGSGAGVGVGAGGLLGGVVGGVKDYRDAKRQGASTGQALGMGTLGTLKGARKGATIGGAIGLGSGALGSVASPAKAEALRKYLTDNSMLSRFGQRQVHALTGVKPSEGLHSIGLGSRGAEDALKSFKDANITHIKPGIMDKLLHRSGEDVAALKLKNLTDAANTAKDVEQMGLTSIPGTVSSLAHHPIKTVGTLLRNQTSGSGPVMKAMSLGLPAASIVSSLRRPSDEVDGSGETKAQGMGRNLASIAGNVLTAPLPIASGMMLAQPMISAAGKGIGSIYDRMHSRTPEQPT